jgi:hypothetical protein
MHPTHPDYQGVAADRLSSRRSPANESSRKARIRLGGLTAPGQGLKPCRSTGAEPPSLSTRASGPEPTDRCWSGPEKIARSVFEPQVEVERPLAGFRLTRVELLLEATPVLA